MTNTTNVPISTQIVRTKKKKKKSLKKDKLFNLLSMETLLEYVPHIKSKYEHLVRTSASLFGYHWNEVINTILYNKYVKNNPDIFRLYISIKNIVDIEKNRDKASKVNNIKEILDPTQDYGFKEKDFFKKIIKGDYSDKYNFKKDGYDIEIKHDTINHSIFINFKYEPIGHDSTNKNEQYKIFKYLSDLINHFIKTKKIQAIVYDVDDDEGGEKRHRIYKNVLEKLNFSLVLKFNKGYIKEYIYQKNESSLQEIMDPTKDYGFKETDFEKSFINTDSLLRSTYKKNNYEIIFFYNKKTKDLKIDYLYNNSFMSTNKNEPFNIFKYISDILNGFINNNEVENITYKVGASLAGQKRHRIYKNVLEKLNFSLVKINQGPLNEYIYQKNEESSLQEIMDPTKDYGYKETDFDKSNMNVDNDIIDIYEKDDYKYNFEYNTYHKYLYISFEGKDGFDLTNKNKQYEVFRTISDLLKMYTSKYDIKFIKYNVDDEKDGYKRHKIYENVLNKLNYKLYNSRNRGYYIEYKFQNMNSTPTELTETTTGSVFGGSGFPLMRGVFNMSKGQHMFDPKNKIVDKIKNKQINKDMSIVNAKQLQEKYLKNIDITNISEVNTFLNENNFTIDEHHIESRKGKINFILSNSDEYTETDLTYFSDDEVTKIYTKIENGKFDNKSDMDKQILDAETLMNEVEAMFMNEEAKHPFTKNIDKINKENSKNSKTYFKELNKGTQDMINRKSGSTDSVYFKNDYDKDSKELNVLRKAIDNTDNNAEYLETVHRGLEDLEPTYPNKKWEENSKKYMGDKLYNQGKKRREEKLRLNQPNTSPGRMNTDLPKPKLNESSDLITFYYTNFNKKEFITESKDNIRQNKYIDKTNFIKLELVTPINEDTAINFNNVYYYNQETGKIYYEKNDKSLTILKESSNKFSKLINLDNTSKYDSKKTIKKTK